MTKSPASGQVRKLLTIAGAFFLLAGSFTQMAWAHYLWIDSRQSKDWLEARSGYGHPDDWDAELAERISSARYGILTPDGKYHPLDLPKDRQKGDYGTEIRQEGSAVIVGRCDDGVSVGADGKKTLTRYSAKRMVGSPADWDRMPAAQQLELEVVPRLTADGIDLEVRSQEKPVSGATVKVYMPDGQIHRDHSDSEGMVHLPKRQAGTYSVVAQRELQEHGKTGDVEYDRVQDYSTLSFTLTESGPARSPL